MSKQSLKSMIEVRRKLETCQYYIDSIAPVRQKNQIKLIKKNSCIVDVLILYAFLIISRLGFEVIFYKLKLMLHRRLSENASLHDYVCMLRYQFFVKWLVFEARKELSSTRFYHLNGSITFLVDSIIKKKRASTNFIKHPSIMDVILFIEIFLQSIKRTFVTSKQSVAAHTATLALGCDINTPPTAPPISI